MEWLTSLWSPIAGLILGGFIGHKVGWKRAMALTDFAHAALEHGYKALVRMDKFVVSLHDALMDKKVSGKEAKELAQRAKDTAVRFQNMTVLSDALRKLKKVKKGE